MEPPPGSREGAVAVEFRKFRCVQKCLLRIAQGGTIACDKAVGDHVGEGDRVAKRRGEDDQASHLKDRLTAPCVPQMRIRRAVVDMLFVLRRWPRDMAVNGA